MIMKNEKTEKLAEFTLAASGVMGADRPLKERLSTVKSGLRLWFSPSDSPPDDVKFVESGIGQLQDMPLQQRSMFATAFIAQAPAFKRLEAAKLPFQGADEQDVIPPAPPALRFYLDIADQLPGSEKSEFLERTIPVSPTLLANLKNPDRQGLAAGYLKDVFRRTTLAAGQNITFSLMGQLDGKVVQAIKDTIPRTLYETHQSSPKLAGQPDALSDCLQPST
jgi:hypothetical protein